MFLTRDNVENLTDCKRPADQIRWLCDHGYRFDVGASGRPMENGDTKMTPIGSAAVEALMAVPWDGKKIRIYQEVILGLTPWREKIIETFRKIPASARVCFVRNLSADLNGLMEAAFNVTGLTDISCLDMSADRHGA